MNRVAAIDCGTNSIRLLIADVHGADAGVSAAATSSARCALCASAKVLTPPANLPPRPSNAPSRQPRDYAELIRDHGAGGVRFVATSASRDARNRDVFVDGIRELLGVEPEVISGDEEAALSFAGASSVLPSRGKDPVLVVDLGGGSTEFVLGDSDGVIAARSVDIGCVRLTERHLRSDPPTPEQIAAAEADVDAAMDLVARTVPLGRATAVVGVAGPSPPSRRTLWA